MLKYFTIYDEAVSHIWLCLNFIIYDENLIFFLSVCVWMSAVMNGWLHVEWDDTSSQLMAMAVNTRLLWWMNGWWMRWITWSTKQSGGMEPFFFLNEWCNMNAVWTLNELVLFYMFKFKRVSWPCMRETKIVKDSRQCQLDRNTNTCRSIGDFMNCEVNNISHIFL